jgi:hypothetical protein
MTQIKHLFNWHNKRKRLVAFLQQRWSFRRSLVSLILVLLVSLTAVLIAQFVSSSSPQAMGWGNVIIVLAFIFLIFEILSFVFTLTWYFLDQIFIEEFERADRLVSHCLSKEDRELTFGKLAQAAPEAEAEEARDKKNTPVDDLVEQLLRGEMLGVEALSRITMFMLLGARLVMVFTLTTISLEYAHFIKGGCPSIFGQIAYPLNTFSGVCWLLEESIYSNLVTMATVGYGDMSPQTMVGRFMVDLEIVTAILFLTFGINMLVTLVIDSSRLAWIGRRDVLRRHIVNIVEQRRTIERELS